MRGELAIVKLVEDFQLHRILLPTAGGPNTEFVAELLEPVVAEYGSHVTACYVVPEDDADEEREREAHQWMRHILRHVNIGEAEYRIIRSRSIAAGVAGAAADHDLVVVGAAKTGLFQQLLFGGIPDRIARYANTSVMLVKRREGQARSWLRRIMS